MLFPPFLALSFLSFSVEECSVDCGVAALPRQALPFIGLPLPYSPLSLELGHRLVDVNGQATLTLPP